MPARHLFGRSQSLAGGCPPNTAATTTTTTSAKMTPLSQTLLAGQRPKAHQHISHQPHNKPQVGTATHHQMPVNTPTATKQPRHCHRANTTTTTTTTTTLHKQTHNSALINRNHLYTLLCLLQLVALWSTLAAQAAISITSPPYMIKQPGHEQLFQVAATSGDESDHPFVLECEAQGSPEPSYYWTKNGARFDYVAYDKRISQKPRVGTLIFTKPDVVDEGLYQCFAENEFGTSMSNSVFLRRSELSSFPEEAPTPHVVQAEEGDPLTINCDPPSGYPKPMIFWMLMSSTGALQSINSSRLTVDPEGKLHFSNVTQADQLENFLYVCSATSHHRTEYKVGRKTRLNVRSRSTGLANHRAPEVQYVSPPIISALRGQKLLLHCIYGGTPLPEVNWRKKGGSIEGNRFSRQNFGKTLVINKVDDQDEGTYECTASNGHGTQLSHAMAVSVSSAPYWIKAPNNTSSAQEDNVQFECLAEGKPKPNLEWLLNGKPLDTQKRPSLKIDGNTLYIESVKKTDMGVYQCNASNVHGYAFRDYYLNVLDLAPVVLEPPEKKALAVQASTVTLKCRVFGAPKPKIKWRRENTELSGGKYKVLDNGDLQISYVMSNDQGTYQCTAENKFDKVSVSGELSVKSRTSILQKPESVELPAGRMAVLRCNAESDPSLALEVSWLYDGKKIDIDSDPRIIQSLDNSLTITKTKELDSGVYTCLAKTLLDQDSASATLTVQDVPNPPRITSLECESFRATLQWTSTGDRRASILSYDIQLNTSARSDLWENAFSNVPASDPRFTLTLQPWLNYSFRVIARNKIGVSLPSEPSAICTSDKAAPYSNPTEVRGKGTTPFNLVISWTVMDRKHHNAPGFFYKVYWKRADIDDEWKIQIINDWKESKFVVGNQPTYVPYRIKVEAHNSYGQSNMAPDDVIGYSGQNIPTHAPRNFRLVKLITPTRAIFAWDAVPDDSLKGKLKGYKIQAWTDKEDKELRTQEVLLQNTTTAEVEILRPFSNNTVHVMVTNEVYSGPPSNAIAVLTPEGVPEAVPSLIASPMGSNSFYLIWKRPEKINGILLGYDIYYEEVVRTELKERSYRNPSIEPTQTTARLSNLKPKTKYRISIVAKTGAGPSSPYFIEATTNDGTEIVPDEPSFTWAKLPEVEGSYGIRVTWKPNYSQNKLGNMFYVQYRKMDQSQWEKSPLEANGDTVNIKGLDLSSIYEVRVVSVDGKFTTASKIQEVPTDGYIYRSSSDPLGDQGWLIWLICAIVMLFILFFLVCFVKQNRGGKYLVREKETALGQDTDDYEDGFDEYKGVRSDATKPLRRDQSLNSLNESDEDSLIDYEGDRSKFEEDGSFIGQYGVKRKHDLPTIQTPGVATFV